MSVIFASKSRLLLILLFTYICSPLLLAEEYPRCADDPVYHALDFWLGQWRVEDGKGQFQGNNHIETILDGCAVMEHWSSAGGSIGKSLFYVIGGQWRQVWVTPYALVTGGIKEKHEVLRLDEGGIQFQGEITSPDGSTYLDRTSLRPLETGKVHQLIEVSTDGGANWQASFDAIYLPVE